MMRKREALNTVPARTLTTGRRCVSLKEPRLLPGEVRSPAAGRKGKLPMTAKRRGSQEPDDGPRLGSELPYMYRRPRH